MCNLHLQHILILTSHISIGWLMGSYHVGQCSFKARKNIRWWLPPFVGWRKHWKIIVGKLGKRQIDQLTLSINPTFFSWNFKNLHMGLGGSVVKNLPANTKDTGSIPDPRRPPCHGATKPVHYNYWACALEPRNHSYWSLHTLEPVLATREATAMRSPHAATRE